MSDSSKTTTIQTSEAQKKNRYTQMKTDVYSHIHSISHNQEILIRSIEDTSANTKLLNHRHIKRLQTRPESMSHLLQTRPESMTHIKATKVPATNYYRSGRTDRIRPGLVGGDPSHQTGERSWKTEGLGSEFMPMTMTSGMKP
jgi:hypothetical protein